MTASTLRADAVRVVLDGVTVLDDASLAVEPGWTAIVGPNGAGKSTLLRALAGLVPVDAGSVRLDGRPIGEWPARARASRIAWLAQLGEDAAAGDLTARDAVQLGRLPSTGLFGTPAPRDAAIVADAMRATACDDLAARSLASLSGGERQRVLLARALAVGAGVLLLDEPLAHLDPPHQVAMASLFRDLAAAGKAVVTVVHDLAYALAADRLAIVVAGRVQARGDCADPSLHAELADAFGGAIAIRRVDGSWTALPRWPRR